MGAGKMAAEKKKGADRLWDIGEVSRYLHVPTSAIYKMTSRRTIPHVKIDGRLRFRQAEIDQWLELLSISNLDRLATSRSFAKRRRTRKA